MSLLCRHGSVGGTGPGIGQSDLPEGAFVLGANSPVVSKMPSPAFQLSPGQELSLEVGKMPEWLPRCLGKPWAAHVPWSSHLSLLQVMKTHLTPWNLPTNRSLMRMLPHTCRTTGTHAFPHVQPRACCSLGQQVREVPNLNGPSASLSCSPLPESMMGRSKSC